jgi:eukaryotic-like serine/threonine-protein kinase
VDFPQESTHPAVLVNWEDAKAFCEWLTRHEIAANKLEEGQVYRLPTDAEWSAAAGMAPEGGATPEQRDGIVRDLPWGKAWPPPAGAGNFADTALKRGSPGAAKSAIIANYTDGFAYTAPVGSFPANKFGLHDMCGNVWQWVGDTYTGGNQRKDFGVLRGGSWGTHKQEELRLGYRDVVGRSERDVIFGFRCVIAPER